MNFSSVEYPRTCTHVGITVPDLDQAVQWYQTVLGCYVVAGPFDLVADDSHFGQIAIDIFGEGYQSGRLIRLAMGNQIGLEIFEFHQPKSEIRENNFEYWKHSFSHTGVFDPNLEALVDRIVEHGGKQHTRIWEIVPGSGRQLVLCQDPWGNPLEIYTHSLETMWLAPA
jgi:predicted enzyme related to lactoylglutathione lyase